MVVEPALCIYVRYVCKCKYSKNYTPTDTSLVVCTDLSGKKLHRQVGVDTVGSLAGVIVITLARDVRDMGSTPTLGEIFPIFITPTTCIKASGVITSTIHLLEYRYLILV